MQLNIILILRAAQALLAILVLALAAYVVTSVRNTIGFSAWESCNFMVFNGVWTFFIALPYLIFAPTHLPAAAHKYALIGVEALTTIFWFAGFIALASTPFLSQCTVNACSAAKATAAFGAFEWALFVATIVLVVLPMVRNRESHPKPPTVETQAAV